MEKLNPYIILVLLFVMFTNETQAAPPINKWSERYSFTTITIDEGLPHNFIDDMIKDSQGFLWIATYGNGLARYDSHEFISFNMGTSQNSLKNNFVRKLCEDNFKRLWIASESGIDIMDLQTLQITQITSKDKQLEELCKLPIHYIIIVKPEIYGYRPKIHSSKSYSINQGTSRR